MSPVLFKLSVKEGRLIKLLIITPYFAPAWAYGGPPKVLHDLSKKLIQRGHKITTFTTNALEANQVIRENYKNVNGIEVYYFRNLSNWLAWNQKLFLPIGLRKMINRTMKGFDCVILQGFRNYINFVSYRYATKYKIPYVLFAFGSLPRNVGIKKIIKYIADFCFSRDMLKNASKLIAQNYHESMEYLHFGASKEKIELVPLGIDLTEFQSLPRRGTLRKRYHIKNEGKVVLFLGRIHKHKGLDILLQALSELKKEQDFKFVLVGRDDGYLSSVNKLITSLGLRDRTFFVGPLYGKDRLSAYVDADIFVLSSSMYEETPVAALEACATATPVIVTKQASIPWLEECQAGLAIDYDVHALKKALRILLQDDDLRKKMGKNAEKMIEQKFDWNIVVDRLERILKGVTAS